MCIKYPGTTSFSFRFIWQLFSGSCPPIRYSACLISPAGCCLLCPDEIPSRVRSSDLSRSLSSCGIMSSVRYLVPCQLQIEVEYLSICRLCCYRLSASPSWPIKLNYLRLGFGNTHTACGRWCVVCVWAFEVTFYSSFAL